MIGRQQAGEGLSLFLLDAQQPSDMTSVFLLWDGHAVVVGMCGLVYLLDQRRKLQSGVLLGRVGAIHEHSPIGRCETACLKKNGLSNPALQENLKPPSPGPHTHRACGRQFQWLLRPDRRKPFAKLGMPPAESGVSAGALAQPLLVP